MSWDSVGRSIERDVTKVAAIIAFGLVAFGGAVALTVDWLVHRHRSRR